MGVRRSRTRGKSVVSFRRLAWGGKGGGMVFAAHGFKRGLTGLGSEVKLR